MISRLGTGKSLTLFLQCSLSKAAAEKKARLGHYCTEEKAEVEEKGKWRHKKGVPRVLCAVHVCK